MEHIRSSFDSEVLTAFTAWQEAHRYYMDEAESIEEFAHRKYEQIVWDEAVCRAFIEGDLCAYSKMEQECIDCWKSMHEEIWQQWPGGGIEFVVNMWKYIRAIDYLRATVYENPE